MRSSRAAVGSSVFQATPSDPEVNSPHLAKLEIAVREIFRPSQRKAEADTSETSPDSSGNDRDLAQAGDARVELF
jgi:hypothetical protein